MQARPIGRRAVSCRHLVDHRINLLAQMPNAQILIVLTLALLRYTLQLFDERSSRLQLLTQLLWRGLSGWLLGRRWRCRWNHKMETRRTKKVQAAPP